eukprot:1464682-Prorocentrum_lima.AAC.1
MPKVNLMKKDTVQLQKYHHRTVNKLQPESMQSATGLDLMTACQQQGQSKLQKGKFESIVRE